MTWMRVTRTILRHTFNGRCRQVVMALGLRSADRSSIPREHTFVRGCGVAFVRPRDTTVESREREWELYTQINWLSQHSYIYIFLYHRSSFCAIFTIGTFLNFPQKFCLYHETPSRTTKSRRTRRTTKTYRKMPLFWRVARSLWHRLVVVVMIVTWPHLEISVCKVNSHTCTRPHELLL